MMTSTLHCLRYAMAGALTSVAFSAMAANPLMVPDPASLQWADTGPQFPDTQVVVLDGDGGKRGPVTLRFRCPDRLKIQAHTHPGAERVTVLQGAMRIGLGKKYDDAGLTEIKTGGHFVLPAKAPHYAECIGDTIIEIHTDGPLGTTYVNAADDPSKKK